MASLWAPGVPPRASEVSEQMPTHLANRGVKPEAVSIVYNPDSTPEVAAAQELRDFVHRMTGQEPRMQAGADEAQCPADAIWMVVGRTRLTKRWVESGVLADPATKHPEAYVVRSLAKPLGQYVVFLGGTGIATLYSVYHYLEDACEMGFFWDGDHVPHRGLIPVNDLDLTAQPHFRERMYMNLCLYWYSTPWWDWEDWRQYIDWCLKSRLNILSLWDTPGEDAIWKKTWKKFGVEIADNSYSGPPYGIFAPVKYGIEPPLLDAWRQKQSDLNSRIIKYARSRGMRVLGPAVSGVVPPEFARVYPNARTFQVSWNGLPKQSYVHPSDPLYHQAGRAFLEEYISLNGSDHLYWIENYLECTIDGSDELQAQVRREIAGANFRVLDEVDPHSVGYLPGWTYFIFPGFWTPQIVKEHFSRVPADRAVMLDFFADVFPLHKQMDYFWGLPWHFGVIHAFAGQTYMRGSMELMERQIREVVADPRAGRCIGFSLLNEVSHHNYFYYQFLVKLGWNPSEVDLRSFTHRYAVERYGAAAAPPMARALEELLMSVYAGAVVHPPLYLHRLGDPIEFRFAENREFIPHLRRAMEYALDDKAVQTHNPFYLHDLNDMARQYLAELFNAHVLSMIEAEKNLDATAFERDANLLERILDEIAAVMSYDDYYWLSPFIRNARSLPGVPADIDVRVRDILTLWDHGRGQKVLRDYACRDYFEIVQGYYRPRVQAYVQSLRGRLQRGQMGYAADGNLNREYEEIEKKWVAEGFPIRQETPNPQALIGRVREMLKNFAA
jgi:alpha-N-acetylglucosaminidase